MSNPMLPNSKLADSELANATTPVLEPPSPSKYLPTGADLGPVLLRITLGVIILVTWKANLDKDLYTGDGLAGFLSWLFDSENGNASSLGAVDSVLDSVVASNSSFFGPLQLVVELAIGVGLLLGVFTRFFSALACAFFLSLLLAYFGGHEWIWTYVLLFVASLAVFLGYGGRKFGLDQLIVKAKGSSPMNMFW